MSLPLEGSHKLYKHELFMSEMVHSRRTVNIWNEQPAHTMDFRSLLSFKKTINNIHLHEL